MPTENYKGYTLNEPESLLSEMGWREKGNLKKLIDKDEAQNAVIEQNAALTENRFVNMGNTINGVANSLSESISGAKSELINRIIAVYGNQYEPASDKTNIALSDRIDALSKSVEETKCKCDFDKQIAPLMLKLGYFPAPIVVKVSAANTIFWTTIYPSGSEGAFFSVEPKQEIYYDVKMEKGWAWLRVCEDANYAFPYGVTGCPFPDGPKPTLLPLASVIVGGVAQDPREFAFACSNGYGRVVQGCVSGGKRLWWDALLECFVPQEYYSD